MGCWVWFPAARHPGPPYCGLAVEARACPARDPSSSENRKAIGRGRLAQVPRECCRLCQAVLVLSAGKRLRSRRDTCGKLHLQTRDAADHNRQLTSRRGLVGRHRLSGLLLDPVHRPCSGVCTVTSAEALFGSEFRLTTVLTCVKSLLQPRPLVFCRSIYCRANFGHWSSGVWPTTKPQYYMFISIPSSIITILLFPFALRGARRHPRMVAWISPCRNSSTLTLGPAQGPQSGS